MCQEEVLDRTRDAFHAEQRDLITRQCHLLQLSWQEDGTSRLKAEWTFILNDLERSQLILVQTKPARVIPEGFPLLLSCSPAVLLHGPARQKPTSEGGGKRVARDGGQAGSCGELNLQTEAYLQITEPRGWKRNPPSVIVSHVLPPPVIFSRLKHAPGPYSEDRPQFHRRNPPNKSHKTGIAFPLHAR